MKAQAAPRSGVVSQPLYAQVRERLLERIVNKEWQHGQVLPNEFDLARQFGVSIGTIRKAVEGLEAAKIVVRKQGRGTFVARESTAPATDPVSWFADAGIAGERGDSATITIERRPATAVECTALMLQSDKTVISIRRRRSFATGARVLDQIALPQHLFFDFETSEPLPGNLYEFYGDYFGVRVVKCGERVLADMVALDLAAALGVSPGTPTIKIERTSYSATGEPIEWRESSCILPRGLSLTGLC